MLEIKNKSQDTRGLSGINDRKRPEQLNKQASFYMKNPIGCTQAIRDHLLHKV